VAHIGARGLAGMGARYLATMGAPDLVGMPAPGLATMVPLPCIVYPARWQGGNLEQGGTPLILLFLLKKGFMKNMVFLI